MICIHNRNGTKEKTKSMTVSRNISNNDNNNHHKDDDGNNDRDHDDNGGVSW